MLKTNKFWLIVIVFIVIICIVAQWLIIGGNQAIGKTAHIYSNGELVETIDLSRVYGPYTITVRSIEGGFNIVKIEPGRIRVEKSDCRDGLCVKQGFISRGYVPIVCLPNKLVIKIEGSSDIDGVVR